MSRPRQLRNGIRGLDFWMTLLAFLLGALMIVLAVQPSHAQTSEAPTFQVIHNFTAGGDGAHPYSTLTLDPAGALYGTTTWGGPNNCSPPYECGTIFKLSPRSSGWVLQTLYTFDPGSGQDGYSPAGQLARHSSGILYGTTSSGGAKGDGSVFALKPSPTRPVSVLAPWKETRIHDFNFADGDLPNTGDVLLDSEGNLYGTTQFGGLYGAGAVYRLAPSGGGWIYTLLYSFTQGNDGGNPHSGVTLDAQGNLYGTAYDGGYYGEGTVYKLTPSGSETVLYNFTGKDDGYLPYAGVIFDSAGNLYGATPFGGSGGGGVVFELSPVGGGWSYTEIYPLPGSGWGVYEKLTFDANGSLYGTMAQGGQYGYGTVFKLTNSNGSWSYTSLHDFSNGADGAYPYAGVVLDSNGNLYGTTSYGGTGSSCNGGCGVVWEITP